MTEPAVPPLELRSHLFDNSYLRDRWPRLQSAYTGSKATVTTVGPCPRTSDHMCLYWVTPMLQVTDILLSIEPNLRREQNVNYADRGCWNGRFSLPHCTFHQRGDDSWCGAVVSSGKSSETRSLPIMCFTTFVQDVVGRF